MDDQQAAPDATGDDSAPLDPSPDVLARLDALGEAGRAEPEVVEHQIRLWQAAAALERWVFVNRGTAEDPRPYAIAPSGGPMLCVYSSGGRARDAALEGGLVERQEDLTLIAVPLPDALDWAMSFGEMGVVGVVLDYPRLGAWCPLPNLARLRESRPQE